ncbi:MAG: hypothetical protein RL527_245, partial [Planctomycetota bacterium]
DEVVQLSSSYHSAAVRTDGSVVCWGSNTYGQSSVPVGLPPVARVSAGPRHTVALLASGLPVGHNPPGPAGVAAWGSNAEGQCTVPAGLNDAVSVAAGGKHTVALRADGSVRCWGSNQYGQCNAQGHVGPVVQATAGWFHTFLLQSDGQVVLYGLGGQEMPEGLGAITTIVPSRGADDSTRLIVSMPRSACPADFDRDGIVSGADLAVMLAQWGQVSYALASDINADGIVDQADLGLLLAAWGVCSN